MRARAADLVVGLLGKRGYALTRPRFHEENSIDVRALLAEPIERANGRFVVLQIGANDGVVNDPIRDAVVARGWDLYAVEPIPEVFEKLRQTYAQHPRVRCIQCAVGHSDGTADLFYLGQDNLGRETHPDQYTSFSREVIEQHWRHIPDVKQRVQTVSVPVLTLESLIAEHDVPPVDLLQIDTEGFDFEIIKMAFAAKIVPPILAFEWVNLSQADMWECRCALIEHGYRWIINKGDVIASRTDAPNDGCS